MSRHVVASTPSPPAIELAALALFLALLVLASVKLRGLRRGDGIHSRWRTGT